MYSVITQNGNDAQYLTRILVDTEADLTNTPTIYSPGSTALVVATGDEFMLNNQKRWFKYIQKTDGGGSGSSFDPRGNVPTPMGTIASIDELPTTENQLWDMYMVGPNEDGSYDEYYWTANETWELMGKSIPNLDDVIKKQVLYSGDNETGTIVEPANGTILKTVYDKIAIVDEKIDSLDFKRLDDNEQEDDFINQVSVLINDNVVARFFSPSTVVDTQSTFVAEELVNYFTDNNITPTTYDGNIWNSTINPISSLTSDNGPYLVLITNTNTTEQYHIKNLHQIFVNTISTEVQNLQEIQDIASSITNMQQDIQDIQDTLDTLEESSTLQII